MTDTQSYSDRALDHRLVNWCMLEYGMGTSLDWIRANRTALLRRMQENPNPTPPQPVRDRYEEV